VIFLRCRERKAHAPQQLEGFGVSVDVCARPTPDIRPGRPRLVLGLALRPVAQPGFHSLHSPLRPAPLSSGRGRCYCDGSQPRGVGERGRLGHSCARSHTVGLWTLPLAMGSSGCSWSLARYPATRSLRGSWRLSGHCPLCPSASLALAGMCSPSSVFWFNTSYRQRFRASNSSLQVLPRFTEHILFLMSMHIGAMHTYAPLGII
jgi:hypothetical protein